MEIKVYLHRTKKKEFQVADCFSVSVNFDELPEDKKEEYYKAIPLHRFADVSEVASLVSFLVSDEASYITGQTITLDGGLSI